MLAWRSPSRNTWHERKADSDNELQPKCTFVDGVPKERRHRFERRRVGTHHISRYDLPGYGASKFLRFARPGLHIAQITGSDEWS